MILNGNTILLLLVNKQALVNDVVNKKNELSIFGMSGKKPLNLAAIYGLVNDVKMKSSQRNMLGEFGTMNLQIHVGKFVSANVVMYPRKAHRNINGSKRLIRMIRTE